MMPDFPIPSGRIRLCVDWDHDPTGAPMDFHLTYEGVLYGSSRDDPRREHKHDIRRVFHRQLRHFWDIHPWLSVAPHLDYEAGRNIVPPGASLKDGLAQRFRRGNYRFVPLARAEDALICSLDILFLRPDPPGSLIKSADMDSRLKTLFDALKIPSDASQLGNYQAPKSDEDPFFCLLEDDKLISHVSVETDTLLEPTKDAKGNNYIKNDSRLFIQVKIKPYVTTRGNLGTVLPIAPDVAHRFQFPYPAAQETHRP